jgi:hypothetical protein
MTLDVPTVDTGTGCTSSALMGSSVALVGAVAADRPSSGQVQMEDLKIEHDGKPCGIDGHPCTVRFGSCCCRSRRRSRRLAVARKAILGALTTRGCRGCKTGECSREKVF